MICHWSLRKRGFLTCIVNVCCFRCPWEENVVLDQHCLGFACLEQVHVPKLRLGCFFWKSPPMCFSDGWLKAVAVKRNFRSARRKQGHRCIQTREVVRSHVTIFTFFCFSLPLQMVYQDLLGCVRCFQSPMDASVSIIIAFVHIGRIYGRSQWVSVSFFNQISAISSNPGDKAKPKLPFDLWSTNQPLCLCPHQVLQRIKKN